MGRIVLGPGSVLRFLWVLILVLLVLSFGLQVVKYRLPDLPHVARVINFFDVDEEENLPTFVSALLLFATSVLLALIAVLKHQSREGFVAHWAVLAIGFLYIATDDMLTLHEAVVIPAMYAVRPHLPAFLYFAWVIPAGVVVLGGGLAYRGFVRALPGRSQALFVLSAAVYVFGALGMELLSGVVLVARAEVKDLLYSAITTVEEGCEMFGVALFIYALLDYLGISYGGLDIRLR
jgi:hypothetical protein